MSLPVGMSSRSSGGWVPKIRTSGSSSLPIMPLLLVSFFDLRHDLYTEVQHGMGIADKIATAGKNEIQVVIQFQAAADVEGEVGPAVGNGCSIAEELKSQAQAIVDLALQYRAGIPVALCVERS